MQKIGSFPSGDIFDTISGIDIAVEKSVVYLALSGKDFNKKDQFIIFDGNKVTCKHIFKQPILKILFID